MSLLEYLGVKPTLPRFAMRLLKAIPRDHASAWSFDGERGLLVSAGGGEISLRNMFAEYSNHGASERAGLIEKYAALAQMHLNEIPELWVAAATHVYPAIRSVFVDSTVEIKSRGSGQPYRPVVFPFVGDLRVRLMYDFGSTLGYVMQDKLETWGQSPEAVLARAIANLGQLQTPEWVDSGRGFFQLASPMSFGETMLLLDSVVRALPFAEHAVLMPCNRGILLAADCRSEQALGVLLQEAERCMQEEPWPMSSLMCQREEIGLVEFKPPVEKSNLAHGIAIRHMAENYAAQKEALDALHEASGEDIYVAEYTVIRVDDQWQSYCVWAHGVRALLPMADWVALVPEDESAPHIRVPWPPVAEICAGRLIPTKEEPPRFEVQSFPDEREWLALGEHAIVD